MAEGSETSLSEQALLDPLAVADELVDRLKASESVVVLLAGTRHSDFQTGSPLLIGEQVVATSHFEMEVLAAAISGKPIHLFKLQGFNPGPRLRALLNCLRFAYPEWSSREEQTESEVIRAVEKILRDAPSPRAAVGRNRMKGTVHAFFLERGRVALNGGPEVNFLNGELEVRGGEVNVRAVEQVIADASGFVPGGARGVGAIDVQKRLSRAWIALRELMACSFDPEDRWHRSVYRPELLPLWDRALNAWSGAAAWSSLHGHIYLGPVATLSAIAKARRIARNDRQVRLSMDSNSLLHPYGGFASAWYSIAQRLPLFAARHAYEHSLRNVNLGLQDAPKDSGLHAVRGSIELRLGRPWRAVADYEKAWRQHPCSYVECPETGQIITELAFGSIFVGRWIRARRLADRGLEQMRRLETEDGFLARALRKCAMIHKITGNLRRAKELQEEAKQIALRTKAFDQVRGN